MQLFRLVFVSLGFIVTLSCGQKQQNVAISVALKPRKDTTMRLTTTTVKPSSQTPTTSSTAAQSNIYRIKRLHLKDEQYDLPEQSAQWPHKEHRQRQQQLQQRARLATLHDETKQMLAAAPTTGARAKTLKNLPKNSHGLNKKLLNKLGFTKVKSPNSHNRKRLAVESRHHASADDSHMFIIKLPPNFHYYTNPKATAEHQQHSSKDNNNNNNNKIHNNVGHSKNSLQQTQQPQSQLEMGTIARTGVADALDTSANTNGKKVSSFPFASNGKPGRIYHWNLPLIKKLLEDRERYPHIGDDGADLIDIKDVPTWTKPWENEIMEQTYGKTHYKKSLKRKSPSYYAPTNVVNKNSFKKYFAGNGKPKGFYVIKENQKRPLYYKNIVA